MLFGSQICLFFLSGIVFSKKNAVDDRRTPSVLRRSSKYGSKRTNPMVGVVHYQLLTSLAFTGVSHGLVVRVLY